jgi:hypothetical protein
MFNFFKSDRLAKAYKAIESDNLEQLANILKKIEPSELNTVVSDQIPSLAEHCVLSSNPKALKLVLEHGASADLTPETKAVNSLYSLALQQKASHALLSPLLSHGNEANMQQLMLECFESNDDQHRMLNISLLMQHGAAIDNDIVHLAMETENLPLINFLFNSGANLPDDIQDKGYKEEVVAYAQKCVEDLKIREMFLR